MPLSDEILRQAAKSNKVVGSKIAEKSSGLSAATGVANVEIMKMAALSYFSSRQWP